MLSIRFSVLQRSDGYDYDDGKGSDTTGHWTPSKMTVVSAYCVLLFISDLLLLDKTLTSGAIYNTKLTWFTLSFGLEAKMLASVS